MVVREIELEIKQSTSLSISHFRVAFNKNGTTSRRAKDDIHLPLLSVPRIRRLGWNLLYMRLLFVLYFPSAGSTYLLVLCSFLRNLYVETSSGAR